MYGYVGNPHGLPAGERDPEDGQSRQGKPGGDLQPRANRSLSAPGEDRGQRQNEYPTGDSPGHSGQRVHHNVDDDAPDRRSDHKTLRQGDAVVLFPQRDANDHVADGGKGGHLDE